MEKMTQEELDSMADVIWWLKGYHAADLGGCPFSEIHLCALEKAKRILQRKDPDA